jgi:Spy/CpxP family protein refolding chaperone
MADNQVAAAGQPDRRRNVQRPADPGAGRSGEARRQTMNTKRRHAALVATLATLMLSASPTSFADHGIMMDDDDWRRGMMGPGMMGPGYGPGMGMMGPGHGMGMMGPGYGPGMMDGCGPGSGMMGGMGMMGMGPMHMLDLSTEQRRQHHAINTALHRENWTRMGKVMELSQQLNELYLAEPPDPKAIGKVHAEISDIQRQMIEARVAAQNKLNALLTDKQRKDLRALCRPDPQSMHGRMMGN